ncbi:hypothetical protein ONZ45_g15341 [Pleurotus djamor]|nr:hypothetical protein ONZ45_g15341 [Pleurotus djamor]
MPMEGAEQHQLQPVFSASFPSRPDADLVLKSIDNVHFAVHKIILALASPILHDMFVVANESKEAEESVHLEALLKLIYPVDNPSFESLLVLLEVYRAAHKYEVTSAYPWLKAELVLEKKETTTQFGFVQLENLLSEDPLYCYAFARRNDMEDVVLLAQEAWLDSEALRPKPYTSNPLIDSMPYGWYRELWDLRDKRSLWVKSQDWTVKERVWITPDESKNIFIPENGDSRLEALRHKAAQFPSLRSLRALNAEPFRFSRDECCASADDVHFAVHKVILTLASPVFRDMFVVGNENDTEPVPLTEESAYLEALLKLIYPIDNPSFGKLRDLLEVYRAAYKYDMKSAFPWLQTELCSENKPKPWGFDVKTSLIAVDPLYCYAFARHHNMQEVVSLAQAAWLDRKVTEPETNSDPSVDSMPYGWYCELWKLRRESSSWLKSRCWSIEEPVLDTHYDDVTIIRIDNEDPRLRSLRDKLGDYPSPGSIRKLRAQDFGFNHAECDAVDGFLYKLVEQYEGEFGSH